MASGNNNRLFDSSDDSSNEEEELNVFNGENSYAKRYNDWRRKEELQKLKDKYGDNLDIMSEIEDQSEGESAGDEDEESEESDSSDSLNDDPFDEQFFKVFSALKSKAPEIYDKSFVVDDADEDKGNSISRGSGGAAKSHPNENNKSKKFTLQDYHQKLIKEKKGITEEDEQMLNRDNLSDDDQQEKPNGYYEELYDIRREIKDIVEQGKDITDDDDDDQLFSVKSEVAENGKISNPSKSSQSREKDQLISQIWSKSKQLDKGDEFLKDYIVNKRYLDGAPSKSGCAKRFKEIETHFGGGDFDNKNAEVSKDDDSESDDAGEADEEEKEKEEGVHIAKYHYEEPDATVIKRYPRAIESIRDTIIKDKKTRRAEAREKKKQEKQMELKRLRKLKREEIESKIAKLKEISGNQSFDIKDLDLNVIIDDESEFDMEKYDQKMQLLFGDSYYNTNADDSKPSFEYIPEIDDDLYGDKAADECTSSSATNSKRKRSKKEIKQKRDIMADDDIGIYEDIIGGDVATRFRYRMVEPNDFGLTDEEILYADDKELNKWCSLKKMSQYRSSEEEARDKRVYSQKKDNLALKKKIFQSIYMKDDSGAEDKSKSKSQAQPSEGGLPDDKVSSDNENDVEPSNMNDLAAVEKKRKKKKRGKKRLRKDSESQANGQTSGEVIGEPKGKTSLSKMNVSTWKVVTDPNSEKTHRKRKRNSNKLNKGKGRGPRMEAPSDVSAQRLKAYGMSNREIKRIKVHK